VTAHTPTKPSRWLVLLIVLAGLIQAIAGGFGVNRSCLLLDAQGTVSTPLGQGGALLEDSVSLITADTIHLPFGLRKLSDAKDILKKVPPPQRLLAIYWVVVVLGGVLALGGILLAARPRLAPLLLMPWAVFELTWSLVPWTGTWESVDVLRFLRDDVSSGAAIAAAVGSVIVQIIIPVALLLKMPRWIRRP
jgi:hypothetical protein